MLRFKAYPFFLLPNLVMQAYSLLVAVNPVTILSLSLGILQGAGSKEVPEICKQKSEIIFRFDPKLSQRLAQVCTIKFCREEPLHVSLSTVPACEVHFVSSKINCMQA